MRPPRPSSATPVVAAIAAAGLAAAAASGCATGGPSLDPVLAASAELGETPRAEALLNRWLSDSARTLPPRSPERARAWGRLAELAAIQGARDTRYRGGPLESGAAPGPDPLVASVYYARQALAALLDGDRGEAGAARLRLELIELIALARLGFADELASRLSGLPALAPARESIGVLDAWELPGPLRPWVAYVLHLWLREREELQAYRFAVLAIEGAERFGAPLPAERVRALETWITTGARSRFVCPESGTPYLPGERRSPISGVPHLEYEPVPRAPTSG